MLNVIIKRLIAVIPTAFIGSVLIFALVQIIPGGAAEAVAGAEAPPEVIERLREEMGLNRPLYVQFGEWFGNLVQGDLGRSLIDRRSIASDIAMRFPMTLELAILALLVSLLIGIPLGILAAVHRHRAIDSGVTGLSGLGLAVPEFWLAMLAVNLFALQWAWFPATGVMPLRTGLANHIDSMVLPTLALGASGAAAITRFTRSGMIDALGSHYVRTAWSLGIPAWQIYIRFALRNAMIPVITVIGIVAGGLIGGAVLVEQVFVIPGLGSMLVTGVLQKDYPTVQGVAVVLIFAVILINLMVDIGCALIDPRVR